MKFSQHLTALLRKAAAPLFVLFALLSMGGCKEHNSTKITVVNTIPYCVDVLLDNTLMTTAQPNATSSFSLSGSDLNHPFYIRVYIYNPQRTLEEHVDFQNQKFNPQVDYRMTVYMEGNNVIRASIETVSK